MANRQGPIMRLTSATTSFSLLALAAALGLAAPAQAGCTPSVNSDATNNTCIGTDALLNNVTSGASVGRYNTAIGRSALRANTTGDDNTANGEAALFANTAGSSNTASGRNALSSNTSGNENTANGASALSYNTTGSQNTASGVDALMSNTTGFSNTASGLMALHTNTTGSANIALGYFAGSNLTTGHENIAIGNSGVAAESFTIRIGSLQMRAFMAGIRGVNVTGGQTVLVNAEGQLGVASSSRRYKQDIQPMGDASDALLRLQPVTFHYRQADENGERPLQYGLIAEDVAEVMPALAIYNDAGAPESVAYQMLPSLLLNEYQKQNRKLKATEAELAATKAKFEAMEAEMAALKLAVSRLAATPSSVQLASGN
jgi:hypothetical protein